MADGWKWQNVGAHDEIITEFIGSEGKVYLGIFLDLKNAGNYVRILVAFNQVGQSWKKFQLLFSSNLNCQLQLKVRTLWIFPSESIVIIVLIPIV